MERIDIIGPVLFDHGDDVLAQSGQDGGDRDRRHYTNNNSQNCQKAAEFVRAYTIQRHRQRFAKSTFWESEFHSVKSLVSEREWDRVSPPLMRHKSPRSF